MSGWMKLYRKIWDSPNFRNSKNKSNMILIWIWLLTHSKNGVVTFGRNQIANDTGLSSSSVWRGIQGVLAKMPDEVNYEANKVFSTITILKWGEYQDNPNKKASNKRATSEQQANTNKNKEERIRKKINKKENDYLEEGTNPLYREWCSETDESVPFKDWVDKR